MLRFCPIFSIGFIPAVNGIAGFLLTYFVSFIFNSPKFISYFNSFVSSFFGLLFRIKLFVFGTVVEVVVMGVVTDVVIEVVAGVIGAVVTVLVLFPNKSPEKEALLSKVFSKDKGLVFLGFVYSGVCFLSSFFIPKLHDVAKSAGGPNKFPILD